MKLLVCNTKFKLDPFSDGGSKRSVQIRELLQAHGIQFIDDPFAIPKNASKRSLLKWSLRAVRFIRKHYPKHSIKSLSRYLDLVRYYALRIPIVLDKYMDQDVDFLWENTNNRDMLYLMKATGHRVIALPHNLESLVESSSVNALNDEVDNLKRCDAVFAISKEETWLLRLLGINASYLPYYPPAEVESFLLSIRHRREQRQPNSRKKFTLLGSATNPPTRLGMQSLIDFASVKDLPFDLLVAGYGTESLTKVCHPHISFLGTLSSEELEKLLTDVDGVIIYQPPTTGALTRIPEMLLAGIPVFANFDATRNYFGVNGIISYFSFEELVLQLQEPTYAMPHRFKINEPALAQFLDFVSQQ